MDIIVRLLNALLMIALPLIMGVYLTKRLGIPWGVFFIGMATFLGSQVVHLPLLRFALEPLAAWLGLALPVQGWRFAAFATLLGLAAGLVEEVARYLVYRFWLKEIRGWRGALVFGTGHGAIEAILFGGLSLVFLVLAVGYRDGELSALVAPDQSAAAASLLAAYWIAPWYQVLMGALERFFAILLHISLAVFVLQVFLRRNHAWLLLGVGVHAALDAIVLFAAQSWGIYAAEGVVAGAALGAVGFAYYLIRGEENLLEPGRPASRPGRVEVSRLPQEANRVSPEQLEDSRYTPGE